VRDGAALLVFSPVPPCRPPAYRRTHARPRRQQPHLTASRESPQRSCLRCGP